jgi:hypothetical protein
MPGRSLSDLGFTSKGLAKMTPVEQMANIAPKWQQAGQAIDTAVGQATQTGTRLNASTDTAAQINKIADPQLQTKAIDTFNNLTRSLGITDLRAISPQQALDLRKALGAGSRFGPTGDLSSLAGVRAQLYRAVSGNLKTAVPGMEQLDRTYSDLEGAMKAAQAGASKFAAKPPATITERAMQMMKTQGIPRLIEGVGIGAGGAGLYGVYRMLAGNK